MKKYLFIIGITAAMFAACSGSEEVLTQDVTDPVDEENVTREDLMGSFPIEFADVSLGSSATVEVEEGETRGSLSLSSFNASDVGMFCLSTGKILNAASNNNVLHSWSGGVGTKLNFLNLWQDNAKAHIINVAGSKGKIKMDDKDVPRYYPSVNWFKYTFFAYHPYTEAIYHSKNVIWAYMIVDGDDDVVFSKAETPHTPLNKADVDDFAYCNEYFRLLTQQEGITVDEAYKPYFNFRHLMSRLNFKFKLKDGTETDTKFHVDSVCFNGFMNVIRLTIATKDDNGITSSGDLSWGYNANSVITSDAEASARIYEQLGKTQEGSKGHFYLREADGKSIKDQKVNGVYKYNLNDDDFVPVGDCILIPPVTSGSTSNILLEVYLSDEDGNRTISFVNVTRPNDGWTAGKQYTLNIEITPPTNAFGQAPGQLIDWDSSELNYSD